MRAKDTPTTVPNAALVRAMLPDAPLLILIDELVIYMASLNEQEQGALLGFLNPDRRSGWAHSVRQSSWSPTPRTNRLTPSRQGNWRR